MADIPRAKNHQTANAFAPLPILHGKWCQSAISHYQIACSHASLCLMIFSQFMPSMHTWQLTFNHVLSAGSKDLK